MNNRVEFAYSLFFLDLLYKSPEMCKHISGRDIRKAAKKRKLFPMDESVSYLAVRDASKKWIMSIRNWRQVPNRFMTMFEDRLT